MGRRSRCVAGGLVSDGRVVRVAEGAASSRVAAIEVQQGGRKWLHPIESPCGAFAVGVESAEPATLQAVATKASPFTTRTASPVGTRSGLSPAMEAYQRADPTTELGVYKGGRPRQEHC